MCPGSDLPKTPKMLALLPNVSRSHVLSFLTVGELLRSQTVCSSWDAWLTPAALPRRNDTSMWGLDAQRLFRWLGERGVRWDDLGLPDCADLPLFARATKACLSLLELQDATSVRVPAGLRNLTELALRTRRDTPLSAGAIEVLRNLTHLHLTSEEAMQSDLLSHCTQLQLVHVVYGEKRHWVDQLRRAGGTYAIHLELRCANPREAVECWTRWACFHGRIRTVTLWFTGAFRDDEGFRAMLALRIPIGSLSFGLVLLPHVKLDCLPLLTSFCWAGRFWSGRAAVERALEALNEGIRLH